MKKLAPGILLISVAPFVLGGCSSLFGTRFANSAQVPARGGLATGITGADLASLEIGRTALVEGRPGEAIVAFQRALAVGQPSGDALNGLGVAYARIGRKDLAVRYFQQAMTVEPLDTRFSDNLERTLRSMNAVETVRSQLATSPVPMNQPAQQTQRAEAFQPTRGRSARGEIKIVTNIADSRSGGSTQAPPATPRPTVRIELARQPHNAERNRIAADANVRSVVRVTIESARKPRSPQTQIASAGPKSIR